MIVPDLASARRGIRRANERPVTADLNGFGQIVIPGGKQSLLNGSPLRLWFELR